MNEENGDKGGLKYAELAAQNNQTYADLVFPTEALEGSAAIRKIGTVLAKPAGSGPFPALVKPAAMLSTASLVLAAAKTVTSPAQANVAVSRSATERASANQRRMAVLLVDEGRVIYISI